MYFSSIVHLFAVWLYKHLYIVVDMYVDPYKRAIIYETGQSSVLLSLLH